MNILYGAVVKNQQTGQYFKGELCHGKWVDDINDATPFFGEDTVTAQDCFDGTDIEVLDVDVHIGKIEAT